MFNEIAVEVKRPCINLSVMLLVERGIFIAQC